MSYKFNDMEESFIDHERLRLSCELGRKYKPWRRSRLFCVPEPSRVCPDLRTIQTPPKTLCPKSQQRKPREASRAYRRGARARVHTITDSKVLPCYRSKIKTERLPELSDVGVRLPWLATVRRVAALSCVSTLQCFVGARQCLVARILSRQTRSR